MEGFTIPPCQQFDGSMRGRIWGTKYQVIYCWNKYRTTVANIYHRNLMSKSKKCKWSAKKGSPYVQTRTNTQIDRVRKTSLVGQKMSASLLWESALIVLILGLPQRIVASVFREDLVLERERHVRRQKIAVHSAIETKAIYTETYYIYTGIRYVHRFTQSNVQAHSLQQHSDASLSFSRVEKGKD